MTASTNGFLGTKILNLTGAGSMVSAPRISVTAVTDTSLSFAASPTAQPAGDTLSEWVFQLTGNPGETQRQSVSGAQPSGASATFTDLIPGRSYTVFVIARPLAGIPRTNYTVWGSLSTSTPPTTTRISGIDRFATAAAVAQEFDTADVVYVANGLNFPDALSAAPAAGFQNAPLLLTGPDSLPSATAAEIVRLQPDRIVVVGGSSVVSDAVEAALEALYPGPQVDRIAGSNRYETSRLISADAFGTDAATAFIATGTNFPDALSASAAAAKAGGPVILVPGTTASIDADTFTLLDTLNTTKVYIAGGPTVVSPGIESSLDSQFGAPNVERLAGASRYETGVAINTEIFATSSVVYLAVGTGYADALAGAALAGKNGAPLFVVPGNCVPQAVLTAINVLGATSVVLFGGTGALSTAVANLTPCA